MEPPRLTHVRVNVSDLGASIQWCERLLGVRAKDTGHRVIRRTCTSHSALRNFALGRYDPAPAVGARFNFEVDDVEAWWARIGADADIVEPLFDTSYGSRKFTIRDPDGNELGFVQS